MNIYCQNAFHQLEVVIASLSEIIGQLSEEDLTFRPTQGKFSVGETLAHLAMIPIADGKVLEESSEEDMITLYSSITLTTKSEISEALYEHFSLLKEQFDSYSEKELFTQTTSWWGVTYTRFEWLLEIIAHMYHHRGQLHAMLVHTYNKDPEVLLFE
ncbi:DinB family protein [Halobacillus ihumii]|uniref:DinB family protein n=1 Tax=Halobacillus ihumii TaxID=2686092 RepID=UPI0013D85253|nr:DinB family protein [Halobacillus ihumii]